jgi:hypothetical protein
MVSTRGGWWWCVRGAGIRSNRQEKFGFYWPCKQQAWHPSSCSFFVRRFTTLVEFSLYSAVLLSYRTIVWDFAYFAKRSLASLHWIRHWTRRLPFWSLRNIKLDTGTAMFVAPWTCRFEYSSCERQSNSKGLDPEDNSSRRNSAETTESALNELSILGMLKVATRRWKNKPRAEVSITFEQGNRIIYPYIPL